MTHSFPTRRSSDLPMKPEAQLGTRFQTKPTQTSPEEAGVVRKSFARCLYNRAPARVDKLLENSDPEGIEYYAAGTTPERFRSDVSIDYCLHLESAVSEARQLIMSNNAFPSMILEEEIGRASVRERVVQNVRNSVGDG